MREKRRSMATMTMELSDDDDVAVVVVGRKGERVGGDT